MEQLAETGRTVLVFGELPETGRDETNRIDVPDCGAAHPDRLTLCDNDPAVALRTQVLAGVVAGIASPAVRYVDLNRYFCDARRCYGTVASQLVYFDNSHLTDRYSRSVRRCPLLASASKVGHGRSWCAA